MSPTPGFCGATSFDNGGDGHLCGPSDATRGSWSLATLRQCVTQCRVCATTCRYVSHSVADSDCSWFSRCDLNRLRRGGTDHVTLDVRALPPNAYRAHHRHDCSALACSGVVRDAALEFVPAIWSSRKRMIGAKGEEWLSSIFPNHTIRRVEYQRRDASHAVDYVPNEGREMGIYLHHVVANYERLAPVTVFTQDDVPARQVLRHQRQTHSLVVAAAGPPHVVASDTPTPRRDQRHALPQVVVPSRLFTSTL